MIKFRAVVRGLVARGWHCDCCFGANQMGHADALSGRQFPHPNVIQFAADVDKATNGSLKIAVHSAGSLIKHPEIKRSVRQGTTPIGEMLESLSSNEAAVYGLDSVPFLATGYDASRKLYAAQKPYLEKQLASEGLMLLFSVPWPPQGIYAKREIKSVDELKGLKFRTYNAMIGRIAALAGCDADADRSAGSADRLRHRPRRRDDHLGFDRRRYQSRRTISRITSTRRPGCRATS